MLQRLFFRGIEGLVALAFAQLILGAAVLVRLLPAVLRGCLTLGRILMILSFRLYRLLLELAAPFAAGYGVEISAGLWRLGATTALSVLLGLTFWLLLGWPVSTVAVALFGVHGLVIGLAWDDLERPEGLQLGVKIE